MKEGRVIQFKKNGELITSYSASEQWRLTNSLCTVKKPIIPTLAPHVRSKQAIIERHATLPVESYNDYLLAKQRICNRLIDVLASSLTKKWNYSPKVKNIVMDDVIDPEVAEWIEAKKLKENG